MPINVIEIIDQIKTNSITELDCTKDEFIYLYFFMKFNSDDKNTQRPVEIYRPIFLRYIYNNRADKEFMKKTAAIHRNPQYIFGKSDYISLIKLYFIILGLEETFDAKELYGSYLGRPDEKADAIFLRGLCLYYGWQSPINQEEAIKIFKINIDKNFHRDTVHFYANLLFNKELLDGPHGLSYYKNEACRLFKENWERNYCHNSLNSYAVCLSRGRYYKAEPETARILYKYNWDTNRQLDSLYNYAFCLENGLGGPANKTLAISLYKVCAYDAHPKGLQKYLSELSLEEKTKENEDTLYLLHKMNWDIFNDKQSLYYCAHNTKDEDEANKLLSMI